MGSKWVFVDAKRIRSKKRLTPPKEVRNIVTGEHVYEGDCVWWGYDPEYDFAVASNTDELDFVSFGRSSLDPDNVLIPDAGLVSAAFGSVSEEDCLVFMGTENSVKGENRYLYMLHENQIFEVFGKVDSLSSGSRG